MKRKEQKVLKKISKFEIALLLMKSSKIGEDNDGDKKRLIELTVELGDCS